MTSSDWVKTEHRIIQTVQQELSARCWTDEEKKVLTSMIETWQFIARAGRLARWIVISLAAIAGGIAAGKAIVGEVRTWLG